MELKLHLFVVVAVITAVTDVFRLAFSRIVVLLKKFEPYDPTENDENKPSFETDPNAAIEYYLSHLSVVKVIRWFVSGVAFVLELLLPYLFITRLSKRSGADYSHQGSHYIPFLRVSFNLLKLFGKVEEAAVQDESVAGQMLSGFNRFLAFMAGKTATKALYCTVHAIVKPEGYKNFVKTFGRRTRPGQ